LTFILASNTKSTKETDSNAQGSDSGREKFCAVQVDGELKHCDEAISKGIGDLRALAWPISKYPSSNPGKVPLEAGRPG